MSDILKEPAFYRTLGMLATSLGKQGSYGQKIGQYGMEASQEWAARRAQEEAEKERKKKQQGGTWGDILSTVGAVAGNAIGGPVGGAIGSAAGSAGGQALGGGEVDWSKVGTSAASNALPAALDKVFASPGQTGAPLEPSAGLQELDKSLAGAQYAPDAPLMGNNGPAPAMPAKDAAAPLTQQQQSNWKSRANDYIEKTYGGTQGLATHIMGAPDRNAVSLNETLKMYPGQTEQSFLAQKQAAQRDDAMAAQKQESAANAAYRTQQAGAAAKRLDLDERRYSLEEKRANKPDVFERINVRGGTERVLADPFTGAEQSATPLAPPKMDVHQGQGGYRTINPYTSEGSVVDAPLPQPPQQPKFGVTRVGDQVVQYNVSPSGQGIATPLYTAPPDTSKAPTTRKFNIPQGTQDQQWNAQAGKWENVPGTVPTPQAGAYQRPADVAKQISTSIRDAWSDLYRAGKGPEDAQQLVDATNAAAEIEVQLPDIAAQHGGIPPGIVYTTNGAPEGYLQIGFIYPDSTVAIENPERRIYMPIPPNVNLSSDGRLDVLIQAVATNLAQKGDK